MTGNNGYMDGALEQIGGAVLFADLANSTGLMEQSSDDVGSSLDGFKRWVSEDILPPLNGRFVKSTGDGFMAHFPSVGLAVEAARKIIGEKTGRAIKSIDQIGFGIGCGPFDKGLFDLYGQDVNLAARLAAFANRDEILLTQTAREKCVSNSPLNVSDLGMHSLRNLERPVRIYRAETGEQRRSGLLKLAPIRPAIAVLPFGLAQPCENGLRVGDIVAEELIRLLSSTELFSVISRLSTGRLTSVELNARSVGEVLGARYIVSGSAQTLGNRKMRLTVDALDSEAGTKIWSSTTDCTLTEILDHQSPTLPDIARSVLQATLSCELGGQRNGLSAEPRMYTRLINAISRMHRLSESEFNAAGESLRQLVQESPRHAEPHAWLAKWYTLKSQQGWSRNVGADNEAALVHTERALDLDPDSSMASAVAGCVYTNLLHEFDKAKSCFAHATRTNPNNPYAWLYKSALHVFSDEGETSLADISRAMELSPIDPHSYYFLTSAASCALCAQQYELSVQLADESLKHNAMYLSTLRTKIGALGALGREAEARAVAKKVLEFEPDFTVERWRKRHGSTGRNVGNVMEESLAAAGIPRF